jgi:hypothetical protein
MRHFALVLIVLLTSAGMHFPQAGLVPAGTIYFNDSAADVMVLGNNAYYEIGLRKTNGAIAYIKDKSTGQNVTLGSRYECLWGTVFLKGTPDYVGGCSYNAAWANNFSYTWDASKQTLIFDYTPDPAASQRVTAKVYVMASEDPAFDLLLKVQNNWGYVLDDVLFPSDTVFVESEIQEALLPILPGVVLEPAFFTQNLSYTAKYPGYPGLFADYVSLSSTKGQIAIYTMNPKDPIQPCVIGFVHDDEYVSDSTFYYHSFGARIKNNETWTSPYIRVRIGQSPLETLMAYRVDNGLDKFPSLQEKLGARYAQIVQSPLFKADTAQLNIPFSQYPALLAQVPSPGILHPVAFQPGGHDQNYPDFLPPAPAWGTTANFASMFQQAQALGLLVMPYTNPTWWDDESPTLQNLPPPLTIADVAALDDQGVPIYENYGPNGGYVISPYVPFVQQRLDQLVNQMTVEIPSDMLFEDQIGARPWLFDHNASSLPPTAYINGWLEHTRTYSNILLMTELGFDRLAETEAGFHGSVLLPERSGNTSDWWGTGTWHPYPLAPILTRDKVLFYQHDLAPETFTFDKATLAWNMAFGYMLSYDLVQSSYGGGVNSPWLGLAAAFQKYVLSLYASERITNYTSLPGNGTQTSFESFTTITNWDISNSYATGEYVLPPQGAMTKKNDGSVVAGIFTSYNNLPLSGGDHYLIEERKPSEIIVRQPMGTNTDLTIRLLPGWGTTTRVEAWAFAKNGQYIRKVPFTVSINGATFTYQQQLASQPVSYYKIFHPNESFLPLVLK